tara:strand:+ start:2202 stop:2702 length:501 start_codon:yes stop_codon:yes gene_type:complete
MAQVLFISEDKLKSSSSINGAVDTNLLLPYMKIAQDKNIHIMLGTDLYDKLMADIAAGSLSGNYATLVNDYIQDTLVHYTVAEALPFLGYKLANGNVFRMDAENGTAATNQELNYLVERAKETAQFYGQRLVDYLCNNTDLFPEYSTNSGADICPTTANYFKGLTF